LLGLDALGTSVKAATDASGRWSGAVHKRGGNPYDDQGDGILRAIDAR
jgi:hypothetical protein